MSYPDQVPFLVLLHAARNCVLAVAGLVLLDLLFRGSLERALRRAEARLSRFANRKGLAIATLFLSVVLVRVSVLPLLPLPVPGIHDEFSYLLLGDTFAHGRLTNPPHPMWVSFETFHVIWLPTYASQYPPGQGFPLALGELLGHPWIGVLLSEAAMCAAILWMLQAWLPARWAFLGAALAALKLTLASYWMNSYWGGAVAALGGALVLGALARILRRARVRDALWMGLGIALLANTRPYEGLIFCIPSAVYFLGWLFGKVRTEDRPRRRIARVLLPLAAMLALTAAFIACYDWRVTGHPLLMPHVQNFRAHSTPIYLWERPAPPRHYRNAEFDHFYNRWERLQSARRGVLGSFLDKLTRYSFGFLWSGALLLVPGAVLALGDRKMRFLWITLLAAGLASAVVFWSFSHYAAALTCVIFAFVVQAVRHLRAFAGRGRKWGRLLSRAAILLLVAVTARSVALRVCDPMIWPCRGDSPRQAVFERLRRQPGKHLVLVHYEPSHNSHEEWVFNGAEIDGAKVLWARDLDAAQNAKLVAYFQDRRVWLVNPDKDPRALTPYADGSAR